MAGALIIYSRCEKLPTGRKNRKNQGGRGELCPLVECAVIDAWCLFLASRGHVLGKNIYFFSLSSLCLPSIYLSEHCCGALIPIIRSTNHTIHTTGGKLKTHRRETWKALLVSIDCKRNT